MQDKTIESAAGVSVIVIAYNEERYIKECIDSILRQAYHSFELIIVNDGSKDMTEKILLSYDDPRIVYVKHSRRQGYAAARNRGLREVKTPFVFFTDADCRPSAGWLKEGVESFKLRENLFCVAGSVVSGGHQTIDTHSFLNDHERFVRPRLHTCNCGFKTAVLRSVGFDDSMRDGCEDLEVMFHLYRKYNGILPYIALNRQMQVYHVKKTYGLYRRIMWFRRIKMAFLALVKHNTSRNDLGIYIVSDPDKITDRTVAYNLSRWTILYPNHFFGLYQARRLKAMWRYKNMNKASFVPSLFYAVLLYGYCVTMRLYIWSLSIRFRQPVL